MAQRYTIFAKIKDTGHLSFDETTLKGADEQSAKRKAVEHFVKKHRKAQSQIEITHVSPWGESVQDLSKYEFKQDANYFNQKVTFLGLFK